MMALSLVGAGAMAVQETELERIERELDILRMRRELYFKWTGPKTIYIAIVAAAIITILLAVLVVKTTEDPLMGFFMVAMVVAMSALFWLAGAVLSQTTGLQNPDRLRAVNIVRSRQRAGALVPLYKVYTHPFSIIAEIDEMIAWREQRLTELKGMRS
jgi:hypothetical protein